VPDPVEFARPLDLARMRVDRHTRLVDAMRARGLDAALLLAQGNVGYATGARVPAADQGRAAHRRSVALVTADGAPAHLWTWCPDGAPPALAAGHVHPGADLETDGGATAFVRELLAVLSGHAVAVDELTMPLRAALHSAALPVEDASPAIGAAKACKTADELECIRRAQTINEAAIALVAPHAVPGTAATGLTARFLEAVFPLGATHNHVDPIWQVMTPAIADGPYSTTGDVVFPTVTTARRLAAGDVVWVDTGLSYEGYMSDYGHTWVVGRDPDARQRDQARRWREIVAAVVAATRPGVTGRDLTDIAEAAAGDGRRPWLTHLYLAHGSGTESAESPFIGSDLGVTFDEQVVLEPGNVVVFEPVVWDDGFAGFRAEQIVAVTDAGCEPLSRLTWDGWE
jgi:Xaa-Pro aminopeptidase